MNFALHKKILVIGKLKLKNRTNDFTLHPFHSFIKLNRTSRENEAAHW